MKLVKFCILYIIIMAWAYFAHAQTSIGEITGKLAAAKDDTNKIGLYKQAIDYYKRVLPDSAFSFAERGLKLAIDIKSKTGEAQMLLAMGSLDKTIGRMAAARARVSKSLEMFEQLHNARYVAIARSELGVIEGMQGNYDVATKQFIGALKIYDSLGDSIGQAQSYTKLGVVNEGKHNLEKASSYYKTAFDISKAQHDTINMIYLLNNMGILLGKQEKFKEALDVCKKGLEYCKSAPFNDGHISLLMNCGIIYRLWGKEKEAMNLYRQALDLARQHNLKAQEPNLLLNIAQLKTVTTQQERLPLLKEALAAAKATSQNNIVIELYHAIADEYASSGGYRDAYLYKDTANDLESEMLVSQSNANVADLETLYALDKSQHKVSQLQELSTMMNNQRNVIIVIAIIITGAFIAVFISYRKTSRLNTELKTGQQELAAANMVKDKMFSVIGHDLRSPTSTVIGMLRVLEQDKGTIDHEERQTIYRDLVAQSEASLETLNKLLLWGSRQIKGISVQAEEFIAGEIIESNLVLLRENMAGKKLHMENNVPSDTCVYTDKSHFDFIVRNLLSNAVKYSKKQGRIEIGLCPDAADDFVCFYVKDEGVGIPDAQKAKIFDAGISSNPGTDNEKGTGLGLLLCKEFVEQNGGRIWVESRAGEGATFKFLIRKGRCLTDNYA